MDIRAYESLPEHLRGPEQNIGIDDSIPTGQAEPEQEAADGGS